ncbi:MFS transporter [Streptomyces sp. 769]|uniref:MFS transporter n=1 Tax=Streptomyces sp. 769 TaxID=1262452 RepID=UPI000581E7E7|nr:MFS transporter [Streptomyces sp. 769]AJC60065.1 major facilitator transporter [Streptomyces sp. 769]
MSQSAQSQDLGTEAPAHRLARGPALTLALIVSCEFMLQLDTTIMNVALPAIQYGLGFGRTDLSWVINAFLLAFGGLLLLGGRAGDILGHRRVFVVGTAVFTLASALGSVAPTAGTLVAARALQGVGAALAAPTGIALLTTHFREGAERNRAFAIYSTLAGSGLALGLVLGGILTSGLSWRWVLLINLPFGALVILCAPRFIDETARRSGRFDIAGALTSTAGMTAVVYGLIRVSEGRWGDPVALVSFALGAMLIAAFLVIEKNVDQPIVPLGLFTRRSRAGAYVNLLFIAATLTGMWFFLVQFLQGVLGYGPLVTGLAFLPMALSVFVSSQFVPRILPRLGAKQVAITGLAAVAIATIWLTRLTATSGYGTHVVGPLVLFGLGAGLALVSHNLIVLSEAAPEESGAASGVLQAMLTVGGSLGLALLVTVFGAAMRSAKANPPGGLSESEQAHHALTAGVTGAFTVGSAFALCGLLIAVFVLKGRRAVREGKAGGWTRV